MRYKHVPNQKMAEKYTYESYLGFLKIGAIREAISTLHNHILIIEHLQNKSRSQIKDIINNIKLAMYFNNMDTESKF